MNTNYTANRPPLAPGAYVGLPLGAVKPRGWLRRQLQLQADGLPGHVHADFEARSWDIMYWEGGMVGLAYLLDDPRLLRLARERVDRRLASRPISLWSHEIRHAMRYLVEYQEASGDARVIPWMLDYYLRVRDQPPPPPNVNWLWSCNSEHLVALWWLYNRTGEAALLRLAERWLRPEVRGMAEYFLEFPSRAKWKTYEGFETTHGVDIAQKIKYPGLYHCLDPDPRFREAVFRGIAGLDLIYGQAGGRYTAHEHRSQDCGGSCKHLFIAPRSVHGPAVP